MAWTLSGARIHFGEEPLAGGESEDKTVLLPQCRSQGNHLEFWAAVRQLSIYEAAIDLCRVLGRDVPWITR
jgi:hypothetical protein